MSVLTAAPLEDRDELPVLRLLPVPASEPPYDDEQLRGPSRSPAVHSLVPLRRLGARRLSLVRPPTARLVDEQHEQPRTPSRLLPDARAFAYAVVQGLLEVQAGVRPLHQLQSGTSHDLYQRLEAVVHVRPRPSGTRPCSGAVRSLHVQLRDDGVAEVSARVQRGHRSTAIALRLEGRTGRWCCVEMVEV